MPKIGKCGCGDPAPLTSNRRSRVCDNCREIERRAREHDNHYANRGRVKKREEDELSTVVDTQEEGLSIVASAMERLESMLKAVDNPAS